MNSNEWISANYRSLQQASKNISANDSLADDLLSESLIIFLEKENVQTIVDSGGALFYLVRIMMNLWKSTTSPFYKKFRSTTSIPDIPEVVDVSEDHSELENRATEALATLDWYSQTLFKLHHIDGESISSISRQTKIPRTSISQEIKRVKKHLRDQIYKSKDKHENF